MVHRIGIIGLGIMGQRMLGTLQGHAGFIVASAWDAGRRKRLDGWAGPIRTSPLPPPPPRSRPAPISPRSTSPRRR